MASRDESLPKFFEVYLELYDFVGEKSSTPIRCKVSDDKFGNESFIKIQQGFLRRMILAIQAGFFLFSLIFLSVGVGWSKCWEKV